jgi:MarR family transcriptional regulator, lower aerobic nicotinate degradation pathway regulator
MASRSSRPDVAGAELSTVDGLAQLSFLIHNALGRRAAENGLSLIQTRLLGVLRDREPTMNELATLLELDKSSITGLIDRAERRGLVERVPSTRDRRAVLVRLTDAGRSLVNRAAALFEGDVARLLDVLSASDAKALSRVISRLLVAHAAELGIDLLPG